jgi:hypothetical protein
MDVKEKHAVVLKKLAAFLASTAPGSQAIELDYDQLGDCLYLSFGSPRPGVGMDMEDGMIVRYDLESLDPIGITIPFFRDYYVPRHPQCKGLLATKTDERRKLRAPAVAGCMPNLLVA